MVVLEPWSFYCSAFIVPIANGPLVFCSIRLLELVGWLRAYAGVQIRLFASDSAARRANNSAAARGPAKLPACTRAGASGHNKTTEQP